jgi:hypothetical protein
MARPGAPIFEWPAHRARPDGLNLRQPALAPTAQFT